MASNTLSRFKAAITKDKLLQTTYYKVAFENVPTGVNNSLIGGANGSNSFDIYCQGTSLPGKKLTQLEVSKHAFKLVMPNVVEFDNSWTTTVLVNLQLDHYRELLKWQNYYSALKNDVGGERGFPNTTALISVLDNHFNETGKRLRLFGIFPTDVPALDMKQDSSDYLTVDVSFAFSYSSEYEDIDPLGR